MSNNKFFVLIFCSFFVNSLTVAEEKHSNNSKTNIDISFGIETSSGNTTMRSINAGFNINRTTMPWRHVFVGDFTKTTFGSEVAERESSISYKSDYYIGKNEKQYIFGYLAYENDDFTNIDTRYTEAVGYGRHLIKHKQHTLDAEIGAGLRQATYVRELADDRGAIGYIGAYYTGQLTKKIKLTQDINYLFGQKNNFTKLKTDLNIGLTKHLSLSLIYELDNNSTVASDIKNTNTTTETNLVYSF